MKVLFADYTDPIDHCNKELKRHGDFSLNPGKYKVLRSRWDILIEQVINASIVGGVAAAATGFGDWAVALKAWGITALIELRKYRKL